VRCDGVRGEAGHGKARQGAAWRGKAGLGVARQGKVGLSFGIVPSFNAW